MGSFRPLTACSSELQLLLHGNYYVTVTSTGAGYSRWKNIADTCWREDATGDNWGTVCYLRERSSGDYWSTTQQPTPWLTDRCANSAPVQETNI
jgi:cellobiose phosphorylase